MQTGDYGESLCVPPSGSHWILDQKIPHAAAQYSAFERQLLPFCWAFEIACTAEGHEITTKPEIPIVSWVMSEKHSNKEGKALRSSRIKWKQFLQEHATRGIEEAPTCMCRQITSFPDDWLWNHLRSHQNLSPHGQCPRTPLNWPTKNRLVYGTVPRRMNSILFGRLQH